MTQKYNKYILIGKYIILVDYYHDIMASVLNGGIRR